MTNSVSSNRSEKYNIAAFFSGVGGIELGFEQTNEFRVVYANEFDKYARQTYQLNHPDTYLDGRDIHDVQPEDIPAEPEVLLFLKTKSRSGDSRETMDCSKKMTAVKF